ncbi:2-amino-4-hydroxy-6-hydroxymethyldihydropteridine diphosphokinase [Haloferula helveola]|uniref:2-amino-4-hydroxy-6-hydroxymethyldihydropteridine pyrophosphokinase n=1 Tax=Haloferula helveola TaxID=490095 RepID=A0ABM7RBZ8_9BACT|nr:2-amino-4-hydroxy-6-hydroxymethyldihydropteridine diphosphokinase [Haloferula helveola]
MNNSPRAGIALGSNLGNRLKHLQTARDLLRKLSPDEPLLQSAVYQTAPVHCPDGSPDFYNCVVEIAYPGDPDSLLAVTQEIERKLGRDPNAGRNAPRIIDVDILYLGDSRVDSEQLELPHPRLTSRRFVLQPLCDIRPDLVLPGDSAEIREHLKHLESDEPPLHLVQAAW